MYHNKIIKKDYIKKINQSRIKCKHFMYQNKTIKKDYINKENSKSKQNKMLK